jgi:adenylosuccinate synthase
VLGITKAYTTRVGEGPSPPSQGRTQAPGERGQEFGTVTGRLPLRLVRRPPRAPDAESRRHNRTPSPADVLDQPPELKICVGYRLDGREIDYLPAAQAARADLRDHGRLV